MGLADAVIGTITRRSGTVIVVMLLLSVLIGSGVTALEQSSSLDQFETDNVEATKLELIQEQYGGDENATTAQLIVRDENALSHSSLLSTLHLQREFRENETIAPTLAEEDAVADLSSVVATVAIQQDRAADLETRREALEADQRDLDETAASLTALLNETVDTQFAYAELNASHERGEIDDETYAAEADSLEATFADVEADAEATLTDEEAASFADLVAAARTIAADLAALEGEFARGEIDEETYEQRSEALNADLEAVYADVGDVVLADRIDDLSERGDRLAADAEALESGIDPSLEEQIDRLESMDETEIEDVLETVLDEENGGAFVFLPSDYEPGSLRAEARTLFVSQTTDDATTVEGEAPDRIVESQLAMAAILDERYGDDGFVFGVGVITDEIDRSLGDSFLIVLPLALLFVTVVLTIAYRDVLDILIGLFGIVLVLVWTFGFMGWAGIPFNQIMIAVPVLLVGLSIDYAIHLFMRHREGRNELDGTGGFEWSGAGTARFAMATVLAGLGVAFVWVTATAVIGFLSNLVSPVGPIRDFGVASAFGIASALVIFGVLVPALKVTLDGALERRGFDRRKRAFGTGGGRTSRFLSVGGRLARRAPVAVVLLALLLTAGGVLGATQLDTTFAQEDFIADDPPAWMQSLPEPFAAGTYSAKANLDYVNERFLRQDSQSQVLVEGAVTHEDTLARVDEAATLAAEQETTVILSSGRADVTGPLSVMADVAATNDTFNETFVAADTNGDDVPDTDLGSVYDGLFAADAERAETVIHRSDDGEYESLRLLISVRGNADTDRVTDDARAVAAVLDGDGRQATATGQLIVFSIIETELFETVVESLLVTLVAVFAFLMVAYRLVHGSALLGAVTLFPIVLSVTWILGTMYLLGIPFNVMTGTITSLTVGLGVAYNIHMSERYVLERRRGRGIWDGLQRSVTGTGGALLGSAATTVGGFGVLTLAILPPLQQFGLITGLTITYAFLGSVFVLPSFLVLWTRYVGPRGGFAVDASVSETGGESTYADGSGDGGRD